MDENGGGAGPGAGAVEVRRSARRRRTVSARREGDRIVVLMPMGLSAQEERRHVDALVGRLRRQESRVGDDARLERRAAELARLYLPPGVRAREVRWVGNQQRRWGSCSPRAGSIRLSDRMQRFPQYVVDDVLVHELAHLVHADHGPAFQALLDRHPHHARAVAFLSGYEHGAASGPPEGGPVAGGPPGAADADDVCDLP